MFSEEIKQLHQRMDERAEERRRGNINSEKEDEMIANLATTSGWEILRAKAESMIVELLEPVDFSDETPLDVRGAITEARRFGVEVLRKLIGEVESTKAAKIAEKQNKGMSEQGA